MAKSRKKKFADFQKTKLKAGVRLKKSQNETKLSFQSSRITVPDQLPEHKLKNSLIDGEKKDFSVQTLSYEETLIRLNDFIKKTRHHNGKMKEIAFQQINTLFSSATTPQIHHFLEFLMPVALGSMMEGETKVRSAGFKLISSCLDVPSASSQRFTPFTAQLKTFLQCAFTSLDFSVRLHAVKVLKLMILRIPLIALSPGIGLLEDFLNSTQTSSNLSRGLEGSGFDTLQQNMLAVAESLEIFCNEQQRLSKKEALESLNRPRLCVDDIARNSEIWLPVQRSLSSWFDQSFGGESASTNDSPWPQHLAKLTTIRKSLLARKKGGKK